MAQLQLPIFPEGVTQLSSDLGVSCRDGRVSYFYGTLPVYAHDAKDVKSFRLFTSQLYLGDQEHTKVPLKAESLYPTMAGRLNATAAFQAPAFLCRKV